MSVALNRRSYHGVRLAQADLDVNGGPRHIEVLDLQDQPAIGRLDVPEAVVAGWMFANPIHGIDLVMFFGRGKMTGVQRILLLNPQTPGVIAALVRFSSGNTDCTRGYGTVARPPWGIAVHTPGNASPPPCLGMTATCVLRVACGSRLCAGFGASPTTASPWTNP